MAKCAAITSKGQQCRAIVQEGSDYCYSHDPRHADSRRRSASIAGRSKPGTEISEVKRQLRKLADDTLAGRVKTGVAQVTSNVLGTWLKAVDSEIREREATIKEREFVEIRKPEFEQLRDEVEELREMLAEKESRDRRSSSWAG
jgi:hypothetical protein